MKFKYKVHNHKRKVGIDFGGYGPNSCGIKDQKEAKKGSFLVSRQ